MASYTIYSNQRHAPAVEINGKTVKYDYYIQNYAPAFQAYADKRRTKKEEIGKPT